MIIKMTVNDNDFGDVLGAFCKWFYQYVVVGVDGEDFDFHRHKHFNEMLNPNVDKELTEGDKAELLERIRQAFHRYVST